MRLELEKRPERSGAMAFWSPVLAIGLTVVTGALIFAAIAAGRGATTSADILAFVLKALHVFFIEPISDAWQLEQLVVKASPLILIGAGLSIAYRANVWNIGAEGQFTAGAILGAVIPVLFADWQGPWALLAMLALGIIGGAAYGLVPAVLKVAFRANEILVSLMLVYVAQLLLDWLVRGAWRDPQGFNFPKTVGFEGWHALPMIGDSQINIGAPIAVGAALALAVLMVRTVKGFEIRVMGAAPRAGRFAGFSANRTVLFAFVVSGGLAGLAGILEVMSTVGHLQPNISPGYGFAAIIVAFLGRLNPVGVIVAGLALAVSYLGGEGAQVALGLSDKAARVFQGILLFYILACDTLILYRLRLVPSSSLKAA